jgi:hypothetical protein
VRTTNEKLRFAFLIVIVFFSARPAFGEELGQLPFGLKYFMSASEVKNQLAALKGYEVSTENSKEFAFLASDSMTKTKTGLFLKLTSKGLVDVTSGRYEMTKTQFDKYFSQMMGEVQRMKIEGLSTIIEDPENMLYVYRDDVQYLSVGAGKNSSGYKVELSFTEINQY